ncbi:hypothetical protein A7U60_g5714 [Sanghuangporus baumii]|uniref:F-box domain-containing protein n=1 Tax=Sanghuangporus baumii TaxID=108892 RepID=A0A9Q5N826_SANBA|nr:hypothetical protein A7U60_g5714 [Sanghuangporus baumii]
MQGAPTSLDNSHRRGVLSLPFDLLICIFALIAEDWLSSYKRSKLDPLVEALSKVCRAFRNAVLHTVSLWTKIDERYCLRDDFMDLMARSRSAPLHIDVSLSKSDWEQILSRVVPYRDRWQELTIRSCQSRLEDVMRAFPDVEFSCLKRISVEFGIDEVDHDKFFVQWKFPGLDMLELNDAVPPLSCLPVLREFHLLIVDLDTDDKAEALLGKLMDFLDCTRTLEALHLDATGIDTTVPEHLRVVELPNIKELVISNFEHTSSNSHDWFVPPAMSRFIRSIRVPNVQEYRLYLRIEGENEVIPEWIASFASSPDVLHSATYLFVSSDFSFDNATTVEFFALLPNLRELIVDVPAFGENLLYSDIQLNLERLRSLSLTRETKEYLQIGPRLILNQLSANPRNFAVELDPDLYGYPSD